MQDDQLTPEELAELQQREEQAFVDANAPLTEEEQAELASRETIGQNSVTEAQAATAVEERSAIDNIAEFGANSLKATADFVTSAAKSVPFIDEVSAAPFAAADALITDKTFGEAFDDRLSNQKQITQEAKDRSPISSTGGRFAGDIATAAVPAAKLNQALNIVKGSKQARAATSVAGDIFAGTTQRISESDERTFQAVSQHASTSALFSLGLGVAGKAGKGALDLLSSPGTSLSSKFRSIIGREQLTHRSETTLASYKEFMEKAGIDDARFAKTLDKTGIGSVGVLKDGFEGVKGIRRETRRTGERIQQHYTALRKSGLKELDAIDATDVIHDANNVIDAYIKSNGAENATTAMKQVETLLQSRINSPVRDELGQVISTAPKANLNIEELWELRNLIRDKIPKSGKTKDVMSQLEKTVNTKLKSVITAAKNSGKDDVIKIANKLEADNMDYRILLEAQDLAKKAGLAGKQKESSLGLLLKSSFVGDLPIVPKAANAVGRVVDSSAQGVASSLRGMKGLLTGSTIQSNADDQIAKELDKAGLLADFLEGNPNSAAAAQVTSRIGTALSDPSKDAAEVDQAIRVGYSVQSLVERPMERTAESFNERSADILRVVQAVNPAMANTLVEMIRNGEDVGPVMEQIANQPEAREFIAPGQGWAGKTYDPKVKAQITGQLKSARNLPTSARQAAIAQLNADGTIPDIEALPKREPLKFNPRDKKKERF